MHPRVDDVSSSFRPPDPKRQLSARIRGSVLDKLDAIARIWRAKAEAQGQSKEAVDSINMPYVLDQLLSDAVDAELQQWGGLPTSESSWKEVLKSVLAQSKQ